MKFISHRGNLTGRIPERENDPVYITEALLKGFDVEIDVWRIDGQFFLGHDSPQYPVNFRFLQNVNLWCHAKNKLALEIMSSYDDIHYFWHQEDDYTITSKGKIWVYPGKEPIGGIIVLREDEKTPINCSGVCSDKIEDIRNEVMCRPI